MKQSLKKRIEKMEQFQSGKVPFGYFVIPSDPDFAWSSRKHFELYEEEFSKAIGTYDEKKMNLHFNNAHVIRKKHSIRIRPERPTPVSLLKMMDINHDESDFKKRRQNEQ